MAKQCTKCKKILDDSLTVCPDCKMGLITIAGEVENNTEPAEAPAPAPAEREISVFSLTNEESAQRVVEYLNEQGINSYYQFVLRERIYKIFVAQSDSKAALRAYTAFYAVEAKRLKAEEDKRRAEEEARRKAEEEARLKAEEEERLRREEEERRIREEEERQKQIEAERIRAQEEAIRAAEEEARRKKEEAERAKAEVEAKIRAAEEAKVKAAEDAKLKAQEAAKAKLAEVERLKAQAEEAKRKAEEAKKRVEEEAKRRAEEERRRLAEEAEKRKAEEELRKKEESEQRRNRFAAGFMQADDTTRKKKSSTNFFADIERAAEESNRKYDYIPKVDGEPVSSMDGPSSFQNNPFFDIEPEEDGPIFVETEPVAEYDVGDTIVVDAVEVDPNDEPDEPAPAETEQPAFDFFSNVKQDKFSSLFGTEKKSKPAPTPAPEPKPVDSFFDSAFSTSKPEIKPEIKPEPKPEPKPEVKPEVKEEKPEESPFARRYYDEPERYEKPEPSSSVVEDMFSGSTPFSSKSGSSSSGNKVVEEVINNDLKKSASDRLKAAVDKGSSKKAPAPELDEFSDLDDSTYRGFVPDYHEEDNSEDADAKLAKSYGFDPEAYKKLKEKTEQRAHDRKVSGKDRIKKKNNPDFIVEEEIKIEDYQGFVPDYTNKEEQMKYYTSRTNIDYSKYRKNGGNKDEQGGSVAGLNGTLRSSSQYELAKLFSNDTLKASAQPQDFTALKSTNFILALTGGQLNSLFTSWLITNCTKTTVKQYEKETASSEDNYNHKIEGIKSLLRSNFGKLDDYALDIIVKRFYNKYLDE